MNYDKMNMTKLSQAKIFMAKLNYVKLNHGLNMYCKFSNFICQIYLNICFGKQNFSILFYLEYFSANVNLIKQKYYSESINMILLNFIIYVKLLM